MPRTRRTIRLEQMAKIALEAIRAVITGIELVVKYKDYPNQIFKWKKRATNNMSTLFSDGRVKEKKDNSAETINLINKLGIIFCEF